MKNASEILEHVYNGEDKKSKEKDTVNEQAKAFTAAAKLNDLETIGWLKDFIELQKEELTSGLSCLMNSSLSAITTEDKQNLVNQLIYQAARRDVLNELTSIENL